MVMMVLLVIVAIEETGGDSAGGGDGTRLLLRMGKRGSVRSDGEREKENEEECVRVHVQGRG